MEVKRAVEREVGGGGGGGGIMARQGKLRERRRIK